MSQRPIYLDNQATTRVDPRVVDAMLPFFTETYGNPGSINHAFGWAAHDAVEASRTTIAHALNAQPREIVFTSSATESNNLALKGLANRRANRGRHIVSVVTEHKAVLDPLASLARAGFEVTLLPVRPQGHPEAGTIDIDHFNDTLRDDTILASIMLANNEIGVLQPIETLSQICRERDIILHSDATQALGKIPVDLQQLGIDLASFSAHKLYGPPGVGCLCVKKRSPALRLTPLLEGGGQEFGLRSGTLNLPGIVGFAKAVEIAMLELDEESSKIEKLRNRLWDGFEQNLSDIQLNGPWSHTDNDGVGKTRLPGNLNVAFRWVDGEALMLNTPQLAVSSGSACTSSNPQPSHVLRALQIDDDLVRSSLRFGLGRWTTEKEIEQTIVMVTQTVKQLRKLSSMA